MKAAYMVQELSRRQKIVLAALAAEPSIRFAPVQVQKLFFLIDENAASLVDGKQFDFEPYDYGPFDKAVYHELGELERLGLVAIENRHSRGARRYGLTPQGGEVGADCLSQIPPAAADYFKRVSTWVASLSFSELVGAIYKSHPAMKENSVFNG